MTRFAHRCTALLALLVALAPAASAGTQDAPELTDDAGDATSCYQAVGNEYADVVAAWISDETVTDFNVNLALNKWQEPVAGMAGYTVQFTHQGVQFGVLAAYIPAPFGDGWEYSNGFVDTESAELRNLTEASGSFATGAPAILTIQFSKSHFPHVESMDHGLHSFIAGSADFKKQVPFFLMPDDAPVDGPEIDVCDLGQSDAVYQFTTGQHSMSGMGGGGHDMGSMGGEAAANESEEEVTPLSGPQQGDGSNDTPGAGALLALVGAALAVALRRRRA